MEGGWSTPSPDRFTPGSETVLTAQRTGWTSGPVWTVAENLAPTGFEPRTFQPIAIHYTYWAIPVLNVDSESKEYPLKEMDTTIQFNSIQFQLYNSLWVLACSIISFHCFLSYALCGHNNALLNIRHTFLMWIYTEAFEVWSESELNGYLFWEYLL
jgi:hypothetical protein